MTEDEFDALSARVFAIEMIVTGFLSGLLSSSDDPKEEGRKAIEAALAMEKGARDEIGYDHPYALKVTEAITAIVDRAVAAVLKK